MEVAELSLYAAVQPPPRFTLEVARTPRQQADGLMHRRTLGDFHGMLFEFDDEQRRSFWMRDTYVSLDLLFLDSYMYVVDLRECMTPLSEASYVSQRPARYVIELKCGTIAKYDVRVGDPVFVEWRR